MASVTRHTTIADETALRDFLVHVFGVDSSSSFVSPALLRWKYWESRYDYSEPRSFVVERDGKIVAHAGLWPVTYSGECNAGRGVSMIDWASSPDAPGAGVAILQRLMRTFDFVYSIGGTEMTKVLMPKVGFQTPAEADTWARPLRPFRQILAGRKRNLRTAARLARNVLWSKWPASAPHPGWTVSEACVEDMAGIASLARERPAEFFRFIERCPNARCRLFKILENGRKKGVFALARVGLQARLAGAWLEDPSADTWKIAFQLAQETALRQTDACELVARSIAAPAAAGAAGSGMRLRGRKPILFYRRQGASGALPLDFQLVDNDSFFLESGLNSFLT